MADEAVDATLRRIMIVDDEPSAAELLEPYLHADGFATVCATSADEAFTLLERERVDLIVLDLTMPRISGLDFLRVLRRSSDVAVIVVTARIEEIDRIVGLELGADDYITKPVSPREAVARVKAVLRRHPHSQANAVFGIPVEPGSRDVLAIGTIRIDRRARTVEVERRAIVMTRIEFTLLEALAINNGNVLSREQLADAIDPHGWDGYSRTIDSHIFNLRKKIERDPANPTVILTVYGAGYKLA